MKTFAVIVLAFLLMVCVTEQQVQQTSGDSDVETPSDFENDACKENLTAKIVAASVRKNRLKYTRVQIAHLRSLMHVLVDQAEELEIELQNLIVEIQEMKDTCANFLAQDCCQIMIASNYSAETGLYEIKDPCSGDKAFNYAKIHVRCDMEKDDGGWIVIQRRIPNGTVNFYRNWEDYKNGFGDLDGEFWIGLENMHELTKQGVELQVTVWNDDDDNETITWKYETFSVASAEVSYRLTVSGGTGNGDSDALDYSNGHYFSTYDDDNDRYSYLNCASYYQGGWWYYRPRSSYYSRYCTNANLNGRHESSGLPEDSVTKLYWGTPGNTFANSEMKIRSKTCGLGG